MLYFLQQVLNGVHAGALYALLAFGYALTNGVVHRTNLAYGAMFAFAGQTMILVAVFGWYVLWLTCRRPSAGHRCRPGLCGALGAVLARWVLCPLASRSPNAVVAATLGVSLVLMELGRIAAETRDFWLPPMLSTPVTFAAADGFRVTLDRHSAHRLRHRRRRRRRHELRPLPLALRAPLAGGLGRSRRRPALWRGRRTGVPADGRGRRPDRRPRRHPGRALFRQHQLRDRADLRPENPLRRRRRRLCKADPGRARRRLFGLAEALWSGYFPVDWRDAAVFVALILLLVLQPPEREARRAP